MNRLHGTAILSVAVLAAVVCTASAPLAQEKPTWADVGPLLEERCTMCHSGQDAPLGLHLDTFEGARKGSVNGPVLIPGDPDASELVRRIRGQSEPRMPLVGDPLSDAEIAIIESWVRSELPLGDVASEEPAQEEPTSPGPGEPVTFAHVERIFLQRCALCHSGNSKVGSPPEGLRLDTYENVIAGGERIAVIPGRADASELVRRIEGTAQPRMPFNGPPWLSEEDIRLIRQWIEEGAASAEGEKALMPVGGAVRFRGILTGEWSMDGVPFAVGSNTRVDDRPAIGQEAEMRGVVQDDGSIRATRLRDR
jgi:mono/diheme cytochrome c family protein